MPVKPARHRRSPGALLTLLAGGLVVVTASAQPQFVDQTSTRFPTPPPQEYTNQVAIHDVDGDGDLDVVFANGGGYTSAQPPQVLRVYINSGAGVFTDETAARTGNATAIARDVEFGDFDGDGDADLVIATDFLTQPRLFINTGGGVFADQTAARLPAIPLGSAHVTLGDVENDGDLDLCFAHAAPNRFGVGPTQLWINDGAGVFTDETAARLPNSPCNQPMDALFFDTDTDGDLDLLVGARAASGSKLFLNNGAGVFINASPSLPPTSASCYSFDAGDYDNDGDHDLLGVNTLPGSARETLWSNNGAGLFTDVTATAIPVASNPSIDDNDSKFLDIDNDGNLDFVIASLGSTERIARNQGNGTFSLVSGAITAVFDSSLDVEVGDLTGDGALDMVTAQGESGTFTNRIYINTGPADTRPPRIPWVQTLPNAPASAAPYTVRAAVRDDMSSDRGVAQSVTLEYMLSIGPPIVHTAPMKWAGHDLYRGQVPLQPCGTQVTYRIAAVDRAGNAATGAWLSFQVTPYADCTRDANLTIADFGCFQTKFVAADPYADCNGTGGLTIADFGCFQTRFVAGCP